MGKITVRHFLNKELNPTQRGSRNLYPVYIQVIVLKKNLKFKSNNAFFEYLSEDDINDPQIASLLSHETKIVESIVSDLIEKHKEELITSKNLNLYSENLDDMIERKFSALIEKESAGQFVPSLILEGSYSEINEIICFYNDTFPLSNISTNIDNCLQAVEQIKDDMKRELFYVYDLFGGSKHDKILFCLNSYTGYDVEQTSALLQSLQYLALEI